MQNSYVGVLEEWKVELISKRARKMGFCGQDLLDAQQQIAMHLLEHPVDLEKLRTASVATMLTVIVDNQLAMLRRKEIRHRRRVENFLTQQGPNEALKSTADQFDLLLDVTGRSRAYRQSNKPSVRNLPAAIQSTRLRQG